MITRSDGKQFFVFDCHTHTGEGALIAQFLQQKERQFLIRDLVLKMDENGVDKAITFPVSNPHTDYARDNQRILKDSKDYPDRIVPFVRINPHYEETVKSDIRKYFELGAKGIKLHPMRDGYYPVNDKVLAYPIFEAASEFNPVVLVHAGECPVNSPCLIGDVAMDFPNIKFIIGHCGYLEYFREAIVFGKRLDNVYLDITELWPPDLARIAVRQIGKEKVLWGTDSPYIPAKAEINKLLDFCGLTDDEIEHVFGKNTARMLDIPAK